MPRPVCLLLITAFSLCIRSEVQADVLLGVGGPGGSSTTIFQTSDQELEFFIGSDSGDTINTLILDFSFPEALQIDTANSTTASFDGTNPTFFGDGNINSLLLQATRTENSPTTLNASIELDDPETLPADFANLFTLNVDATNLPIGDYSIQFEQDIAVASLITMTDFDDFAFATPTLGFTVAAVPEPGSFLLLGGGIATALVRRRRRSVSNR